MTQSTEFPVFVVGSARSGTTLAYSLLLSSGEFPLYEEGETHLLECAATYGPLRTPRCYERFMRDWRKSLQFERSGLEWEEFASQAAGHRSNYADLLEFFMTSMARRERKPRWAEKTPANVFFLKTLARAFPNARFVHVIRDGRDVAVSKRALGWSGSERHSPMHQILSAAKGWELSVRTGRRMGRKLGPRYFELKYEDLVGAPEVAIRSLAEFTRLTIPLGASPEPVGALREGYSAFAEPMKGISTRGVGRWRERLSATECEALHATIGGLLTELGYETSTERVRKFAGIGHRLTGTWLGGSLRLKQALVQHSPLGRLAPTRLELRPGAHTRPTSITS